VRDTTFERAPFGRRGLDEAEVQSYMDRLAEELALRDIEIQRLTNENRQLKHALREWHRQLVGHDAAELITRAQLQVEAQIAQAEAYAREREEEAARRYEAIIAEARQMAYDQAQRLLVDAPAPASAPPVAPTAAIDPAAQVRQQAYAAAILQALDSLAAQVDASRQALGYELDQLTAPTEARDPEPPLLALAEVRRPKKPKKPPKAELPTADPPTDDWPDVPTPPPDEPAKDT
jgi:DivIVA domain-containing protein